MSPPTNQNNQAIDNSALVNIFSSITRLESMLTDVREDVSEIKDDVKEIKRDYLPRLEAKLQFDSMATIISTLQAQVTDLLNWRLQETQKSGETQLSVSDKIHAAQSGGVDALNTHRNTVQWWIIGVLGSVIFVLLGIIGGLLEFYLSHPH